ncbi:S-adenosyl-L-methionine-dependent methyltransferase [Aspergillus pseudotamarii]|uniref:S-adenosyl-L-methionine-dependent methyltransferase n=1 Tax=Aspergillus pseudotamarii TaxID=132259 RepID=A0A5N6S900_ASPPS|nr:S-adenosyl-L-methionine-dependent methyltransferase [Aspergillus pseudotamarii]KAE8131158.1 S-adenosyl-L-methionine-dependent methyltransferase [Aspergillus pseudotamarii]
MVTNRPRRLLARLETPFEQSWAITFEGPSLVAGLQLLQDLGIWTKWTEADRQNQGAARTLDELLNWAHTACEPNLLRRFLRHIAALYVIQEVGVDTWQPTPASLALGAQETHASEVIKAGLDHSIPCGSNLARFLAKNGYKEPLDIPSFDNYRDVFGRDFFSYVQDHPEAGGSFQGVMTAVTQYKMPWTDVYDTQPLVAGADLTKPLFVDVGGAQGLDAQRLLDRHPDLPADILIVQDLPEVVTTHGKEKLDSRVRKMAHDFFQPQPITGARAYFFHAVPHDWPNADVARMFAEVKKVMTPGYSKLLIYEIMLPAQGATHLMTTLDLALMSCTSGLERTEEAWRALLKEGGFKVMSISRHPMAVEGVIEAEIE